MRILIQRVKKASVTVDNQISGQIEKGLLVFLGIHKNDTAAHATWLAKKLLTLRIFKDLNDKMNLDIQEAGGNILVVSQFTLYGNCTNGRRPDFIEAGLPEIAFPLYEHFIFELGKGLGKKIETGIFGASMEVSLTNDGPVTFLIER